MKILGQIHFNIVEYIDDDEQEDYMEMINMTIYYPTVVDLIKKRL